MPDRLVAVRRDEGLDDRQPSQPQQVVLQQLVLMPHRLGERRIAELSQLPLEHVELAPALLHFVRKPHWTPEDDVKTCCVFEPRRLVQVVELVVDRIGIEKAAIFGPVGIQIDVLHFRFAGGQHGASPVQLTFGQQGVGLQDIGPGRIRMRIEAAVRAARFTDGIATNFNRLANGLRLPRARRNLSGQTRGYKRTNSSEERTESHCAHPPPPYE